jgi:hypothetical protein
VLGLSTTPNLAMIAIHRKVRLPTERIADEKVFLKQSGLPGMTPAV